MKKQQIEHLWSILCTNSAVDQQTNNISLFNVLEEVNFTITGPIKDGPIIIPFACDLVTLWKKVNENEQISAEGLVQLVDPNGENLQDINHVLEVKKEHKRLRSIIQIRGLKITTPGYYTFMIKYRLDKKGDFIEAGRVLLYVKLVKNPKPPARV